jgi:tRNA 2-thiouridine synthesizing protein A
MEYDTEIDLSGLNCPLPILKTKAALATMKPGEVLKIIVTNSDSVRELRVFAKQTNSTLDEVLEENKTHVMLFKKG